MKLVSCSIEGEPRLTVFGCAVVAAAAFLWNGGAAYAIAQASDADVITVVSQTATTQLEAYGQVAPVSVVSVNAAETGVVTGLRLRPGMHVRAWQSVANMNGPTIVSAVAQGEADVRSAQAQLDAAEKSLAVLRQQLPSHLTTRQAVQQAESAVAQARSSEANAQSRLNTIRQLASVTSPADGTVLQINSADGVLVSAGQPILTLQPVRDLWLVATYYGADMAAIRVGMRGQFTPTGGDAPVNVRVVSIAGSMMTGGGEWVALEAVGGNARWLSGESGTVQLDLPAQQMVAVPTRALILNQGKWWVLVRTASGDQAQEVVPGRAQGWKTFIVSGLAPGAKVVVNNAYLLFHSRIAEQYQIPD